MVSFPDPKARHPFHMHAMIHGQPAFVSETLERLDHADAATFLGRPRRLVVTGCGTSFHAAMYGARLFHAVLAPATSVEATHAYDLAYGPFAPPAGATVLGVSHSGSTPTTNFALARAKKEGHRILAVSGLPNTEMEEIADETLLIGSVHDRSWANTMSYTTQLTAFASLAGQRMREQTDIVEGLRALPRVVQKALECEASIRRLARRIARATQITFLGSGWDHVTVLEAALKIRETCSLSAFGYHMEQFLHGPFLSIDRGEPVFMLRSSEDGKRAEAIHRALSKSGANVLEIGESPRANVRLPRVHAVLRPIVSVIPMQFLAYYAALARKANPDIMRTDVPRYRAGVEALFH